MASEEIATRIDGVGSEPKRDAGQRYGVDASKSTMANVVVGGCGYRQ
jgi:hypothetical protein